MIQTYELQMLRTENDNLSAEIAALRAEVARLHDIEQRMKRADNDATRFALEARRLRDKALAYDLDQAGIERRAAEAVELVEARAEIARLRAENERMREALVRAEDRFRKVAKHSNAPLSIGLFAAAEDCAAALRGEGK